MQNSISLDAVQQSRFSQRFLKPLYDSYCFSNMPLTTQFLLTGEGQSTFPLDVFGNLPTHYDKVIVFFVDAFGWRFLERYADKFNFFKTAFKEGIISKITSQFPSTTAAHTTCIHTGLPVGQSGVYEWNYYEPLVDDIITPLLFSYGGDKERDTLKQSGIPTAKFFPAHSFYQTLKAKGIVSYIFQNQNYTPSTFSDIVFQGANVIPFKMPEEALTRLSDTVLAHKAPPYYYFLYYDRLDSICHVYGPNSPRFEKEVEIFFTLLDQLFYQKLAGKVKNTLFILTADHGQVEVDPNRTFYLNKQLSGFEQYLRTNQRGKPIVPAGSPRDMFLHIKDEFVEETISHLRKALDGRAEVYPTQELVAQHFFGSQEPSETFLSRVGNVVILPYQNETVWWYEEGKFDMHFYGHHGGLTPEEMEIPLIVLPL
ncbi:MAG: alkaline phosphatase family protein [Ktedonobacteraceae bacterium]